MLWYWAWGFVLVYTICVTLYFVLKNRGKNEDKNKRQ